MTEQFELELGPVIHNGEIQAEIPGVKTEPAPTQVQSAQAVEDIDPNQLAGLMAGTISAALAESPIPSPMEIVTRLLRLNSARGHKVVWTRFDVNQAFAIWSNKLEQNRVSR